MESGSRREKRSVRREKVLAETPPAREMRTEALEEIVSLLDLAIRRSRASTAADPELKSLICGALEGAKQELAHLRNTTAGAEGPRGVYRQAAKESETGGQIFSTVPLRESNA
jgi:hypothetical protein